MTGRRPDRTRVWNFLDNFRCRAGHGQPGHGEQCSVPGVGMNWTTLPGNFKRQGYLTLGNGKTFHPGDPWQFDFPHSWSEELPYAFGGSATKVEAKLFTVPEPEP